MNFTRASQNSSMSLNDGAASSALKFHSAAGICADVSLSIQPGASATGIGFQTSSASNKRPRDDDSALQLTQHLTVRSMIVAQASQVNGGTVLQSIEIATHGMAVAYWVPNKWSLLHAVVVPKLHLLHDDWLGTCPVSWGQVVDVLLKCEDGARRLQQLVRDMCRVRDVVCRLIAVEGERILSSPCRALSSVCTGLSSSQWSGQKEVEIVRSIYRKRRADATVMPLRVGCFCTSIADAFLDAPALHVMSVDAFYCQQDVRRWNALFGGNQLFLSLKPKRDPFAKQKIEFEVSIHQAEFDQFLAAWVEVERNVFVVRKDLQNVEKLKCPLCNKTFRGSSEVSRHWLQQCLPQASAMAATTSVLFV